MSRRRHRCLWCGIDFATTTEHLIHLHEEHPESIGRGRTMSREWTCVPCGAKNRPITATCEGCGTIDAGVLAANDARTFVVWFRLSPTDDAEVSAPMSHLDAVTLARHFAGAIEGAHWNEQRLEAWSDVPRRIAWLEVAEVTAGIMYRPPRR